MFIVPVQDLVPFKGFPCHAGDRGYYVPDLLGGLFCMKTTYQEVRLRSVTVALEWRCLGTAGRGSFLSPPRAAAALSVSSSYIYRCLTRKNQACLCSLPALDPASASTVWRLRTCGAAHTPRRLSFPTTPLVARLLPPGLRSPGHAAELKGQPLSSHCTQDAVWLASARLPPPPWRRPPSGAPPGTIEDSQGAVYHCFHLPAMGPPPAVLVVDAVPPVLPATSSHVAFALVAREHHARAPRWPACAVAPPAPPRRAARMWTASRSTRPRAAWSGTTLRKSPRRDVDGGAVIRYKQGEEKESTHGAEGGGAGSDSEWRAGGGAVIVSELVASTGLCHASARHLRRCLHSLHRLRAPPRHLWDASPRHQPHALREEPRRARDEPADKWVTVGARDWAPDAAAALRSAGRGVVLLCLPIRVEQRVCVQHGVLEARDRCLQHGDLHFAGERRLGAAARRNLPNIPGSLPSLPSALAGLLRRDSAQPSSNSNSNSSGKAQSTGARRSSSPRGGNGSGTPRAAGGNGISYSTPELRLIATSLPSESRTSPQSMRPDAWVGRGDEQEAV
ncbi:hypothetical protein B0H14DRAFT_3907198 [Mycena olivaceomarginata]|nr:hypothetical protein B0H14DRAFT_3907198 [Mycena olivaceomarginata]